MTKEFVPFELAVKLKQLGFDEPCFGWYADETHLSIRPQYIQPNDPNNVYNWCLASTFSQAFRWFREEHGLYSHVRESYSFDNTLEFVSQINGSYVNHGISDKPINRFDTYEEAELECLKKLIEIVKNKED